MQSKLQPSLSNDKNLMSLIDGFVNYQKQQSAQQQRRATIGPGYPQQHQYYQQQQQQSYSQFYRQNPQQFQAAKQQLPGQQKVNDIRIDRVQFVITLGQQFNTSFQSDQLDLFSRLQPQLRIISIIVNEKNNHHKEEYFDPSQQQQVSQQVHTSKLKIDIRIDDQDALELNLQELSLSIITKQPIKQTKAPEQNKKPLTLHSELISREDGKPIQIFLKFNKDQFINKANVNPMKSKQILAESLKQFCPHNFKCIGLDQFNPVPSSELGRQQVDLHHYPVSETQKKVKAETKDIAKHDEELESQQSHFPISDKDIDFLFPRQSEEQINQICKFKDQVEKKLTSEEKFKKLFDELRIKHYKQSQYNQEKKILRCPLHRCGKQFNKVSALKSHVRKSHQKLSDIEFTVEDNGEFKWNDKALDYCLILWKAFPNFVKHVINEMKQRKDLPATQQNI